MRWDRVLVPLLLVVAGCARAETGCMDDFECTEPTPTCASWRATCSRPCSGSADCVGLPTETSCDWREGLCAWPCSEDEIGVFACRDGDRAYCDDPSASVSCAVCPRQCDWGSYCDGVACQRLRSEREPCSEDRECRTAACTSAGLCSVEDGAPCTAETCEGTCVGAGTSASRCMRTP